MKIKIEYEYDAALSSPYVAWIRTNEIKICGISDISYDIAKKKVIEAFQWQIENTPKIPEPEEVEI